MKITDVLKKKFGYGMCRILRKNRKEFLDVSGVGKAKLDRYGDLFLEEIKNWKIENATKGAENGKKPN